MTITNFGELAFDCAKCGNNEFRFPEEEGGIVSCNVCGQEVGTVAEINEAIVAAGRAAFPDIAKAVEKGLKL